MANPTTSVVEAVQNERRRLLIDATLTAIAEYGLSKLTLAKIAALAGLTAGSVNFHFESKEALLLETLQFVAEELDISIISALKEAGSDPTKRLLAVINAQLDPDITEHRKVAVWNAFSAERRGREDYKRICGARDNNNFNITLKICTQIIELGNKEQLMNPRAMAYGIQGVIDDIWNDILYQGDNYDRDDAWYICQSFLASVFPWCFTMPVEPNNKHLPLNTLNNDLSIIQVDKSSLAKAAPLIDSYRQLYHQKPDLEATLSYLKSHIENNTAIIYLALDSDNKVLGLIQLQPGFCFIELAAIFTLRDLYIDESSRSKGVAQALLAQAKQLAVEKGAKRLEIESETHDLPAHTLYKNLGFIQEEARLKFTLDLF